MSAARQPGTDGRLPGRFARLAVDPDVELADPRQRAEAGRKELAVLGAVAVGGVLGAEARYGLAKLVPHDAGTWPWATLLANVVGSFLIGVLLVTVDRRRAHHLVRPLLGTGLLGGFTTFSTFGVDTDDLLTAQRPLVALSYVAVSLAGCLLATALAMRLAAAVLRDPGPDDPASGGPESDGPESDGRESDGRESDKSESDDAAAAS